MFEEALAQLDSMGLPYTENEDGTLVVDISAADKTDVVAVVAFLNDSGMSYTIDADRITVAALPEVESAPEDMEEPEPEMNPIDAAMNGMM